MFGLWQMAVDEGNERGRQEIAVTEKADRGGEGHREAPRGELRGGEREGDLVQTEII